MRNLSKTKKIILGIAAFVVVIIAIDYIWHYIEYKKKIDRIEREHRQEMIELQELEICITMEIPTKSRKLIKN